MKKKPIQSLNHCLLSAILHYNNELDEEQGGFIIKEAGEDNYEFIPITNQISGTPTAIGLYIAEPGEFNSKVLVRTLDDIWSVFASYHTHPKGMRAIPSSIDINNLFTSFPVNFIYAPDKELNRYDFISGNVGWKFTNKMTFDGFNPTNKTIDIADIDRMIDSGELQNMIENEKNKI